MKKNIFLSNLTFVALLSPLLLTSCQGFDGAFGGARQVPGSTTIQRTGPAHNTASTVTTSSKRGTLRTYKAGRKSATSVPVEAPSAVPRSSNTSSRTSSSNAATPTTSDNAVPAAPTMAPMAAPSVTSPTVVP